MEFTITGHLTDATAAWDAISDTDMINRVGGSSPMVDMSIERDEHNYPKVMGVAGGPAGIKLPFEEDDNRWVQGRYFRQGRTYSAGPLLRSIWEGRLEQQGDGVIPSIWTQMTPRSFVYTPIVAAVARRLNKRWQAYLDGLPPPGETSTEKLRTLEPYAQGSLDRWAKGADPEIAERIGHLLVHERPLELQRMSAFELADRWRLDRDAVLKAMVAGVGDGIFELYWSVKCPRCYAQTTSTGMLGDLADHAACASCDVDFSPDLGDNVEVLFAPHPSVAPRVEQTFCTLFPASVPEIEASFIMAPGESIEERMDLRPGRWRIGAGSGIGDVGLEVSDSGDMAVEWKPGDRGGRDVKAGEVALKLRNEKDGRVRVQVVRDDDLDQRVLASYLTTFPEFQRTLGDQVLAPDIRIANRSVSLLFTDLTGSTAMYEKLGDAKAFAIVRDHFTILRRVTENHGGVIVKTIGDAIMAAFSDPVKTMAAALEMVDALDDWVQESDFGVSIRLRVGFHVGPALMVHTDAAGIDYFGGTVNLAARTQGVAGGGDIVWTAQCHEIDSLRQQVDSRGLVTEALDASLKGLAENTRLYKVHIPIDG